MSNVILNKVKDLGNIILPKSRFLSVINYLKDLEP